MHITLAANAVDMLRTELLVVGAYSDGVLAPAAAAVDGLSGGRIAALIAQGDLAAPVGSTLSLHHLPGTHAKRILIVCMGKHDALTEKTYRQALASAARALVTSAATEAVVTLAAIAVPGRSISWCIQTASHILADRAYRFGLPHASKPRQGVQSAMLLVSEALTVEMTEALRRGLAIAEGVALAKDLGNMPGNICNPAYLAATARSLGAEFGFDVEVLEREDMARLGMGSYLAVGQASANPCKMILMHYKGDRSRSRPIVLVGKAITFDTGGISLKPGASLDEMKFDMSGGGAVIGVMRAVARLGLALNVVGVVAAAENMPGGNATRPGDVVTSMSGQTIEILNTDAEGRLALCDALTYVERFEPAVVIDVATLTGACVIALGAHASGLFANDEALAADLLKAGNDSGDRAWQMPLWDDYMGQLKSNFADMSNLGGPAAGSVTAALFLSRFARAYRWAHLDIAGTASISGDAKGSTGRPVPLLADYLIRQASAAA
jgi:leucyl aminopeptidase